jgi:hypothetical protein
VYLEPIFSPPFVAPEVTILGWFRKHNWGAYPRGAQFGCGVAGAAQASY